MSNIKISDLTSTSAGIFQDLSDDDVKTVIGGSWLSDRLGINVKVVQNDNKDGFLIDDFTLWGWNII